MLNPTYNDKKTLTKIRQQLNADFPSIQLHKILTRAAYAQLRQKLLARTYTHERIADKHSYARTPLRAEHLTAIITLIENIIERKFKNTELYAYQMRWKDYTLMHDEKTKECTQFILDFTEDWNESWGGTTIYHDQDYHIIPPHHNTLIIVKRSKQTQQFIKYLNNHAKERIFIMGEATS